MSTVFVTNIPTPYRISTFNALKAEADELGRDFSVFFMSRTESNRNWLIDEEFAFPYKQWDMPAVALRGIYFRFSFSFIRAAITKADHLILGGSWNDLNVVVIALLKRMHLVKAKVSFWTEANYLTVGAQRTSKLKHFARRLILRSADGNYFIPGKMASLTLERWGIGREEKYVSLPNLPDVRFDKNLATWHDQKGEEPIFTIVARLDEKTKGIENFVRNLGADRIRKIRLNIIGSGHDLSRYQNFIRRQNLEKHVFLLGELSGDEVVRYLQSSSVFVLPSFSDPSPLSLIEACKIGLPLLVSDRCGNHHECLVVGENGYLFDPAEAEQIIVAFDKILFDRKKWADFSEFSVGLAKKKFNSKDVLRRLASYL